MGKKLHRDEAVARANGFVAEIDPAELAVRLIERGCHMKRPDGMAGHEAWELFELQVAAGNIPEYIVRDFEAMAHIAIAYFSECVSDLQQKS